MEKIDMLVAFDPEADRIILLCPRDCTGVTVFSMSPDQGRELAELILKGAAYLRNVNAKPEG
jgi:hypothetical protein